MTRTEIPTPYGPARAELHCAAEGAAAVLLGHGAGGGVGAPDLVAATRAATAAGVHVALIEQPYRVAGRRAPAPAKQLDAAWLLVAENLASDGSPGCPWCSAAGPPVRGWHAGRQPMARPLPCCAWRFRCIARPAGTVPPG